MGTKSDATPEDLRLLEQNISTAQMLGHAVAMRDHDTSEHNSRVAWFSGRMGEELGLDGEAIRSLMKGAFLHDIGKIGIPDSVLLKPGRLDSREKRIMQRHALLGSELLLPLPWFNDALPVVLHHHEHFDGTGYPHALKGEEIPLIARVFAMVDVFDALLSVRPYKKAYTFEKTLSILQEGSNKHFDSLLLVAFCGIARQMHEQVVDRSAEEVQHMLEKLRLRHFGI